VYRHLRQLKKANGEATTPADWDLKSPQHSI
jgi:hypothetical protein